MARTKLSLTPQNCSVHRHSNTMSSSPTLRASNNFIDTRLSGKNLRTEEITVTITFRSLNCLFVVPLRINSLTLRRIMFLLLIVPATEDEAFGPPLIQKERGGVLVDRTRLFGGSHLYPFLSYFRSKRSIVSGTV